MAHPKITVVGAGTVGATCALWAAARDLGDVCLVDVVEGLARGTRPRATWRRSGCGKMSPVRPAAQ